MTARHPARHTVILNGSNISNTVFTVFYCKCSIGKHW